MWMYGTGIKFVVEDFFFSYINVLCILLHCKLMNCGNEDQ